MIYEYYMPEFLLFERVCDYLKGHEWDEVTINKRILDSGEIEFTIFFRSNEVTFMELLNKEQFENLVRRASENMNAFKIQVYGLTVCYVFGPKLEEAVYR